MIFSKKGTLLTASAVVCILLLIYYNLPNNGPQMTYTIKATGSRSTNKTKNILYYTRMFDDLTFYQGEGREIFKHCPVNDCFATHDKSVMPIDQFDALMFHGNQFNPYGNKVPKIRSSDQVYIWVNMESPPNSISYKTYNFYNWSMTYRLDSDVPRPYGITKKKPQTYNLPSIESIQKKTKKIAWMVSNCVVPSARRRLAEAMKKLIDVDIFGVCGIYNCPKPKGEKCFTDIAQNYKFYLAFENNLCQDYVTEKFFRTLQYDIVPIVYGGANYSQFGPPNSFIDVSQFESVELLVKYLKELDEDPQKYLNYFKWKQDYYIEMGVDDMLCQLCEKLHQQTQTKIYNDMNAWYYHEGVCKLRDRLPEIVADLL